MVWASTTARQRIYFATDESFAVGAIPWCLVVMAMAIVVGGDCNVDYDIVHHGLGISGQPGMAPLEEEC